jgi:hypothetical protein
MCWYLAQQAACWEKLWQLCTITAHMQDNYPMGTVISFSPLQLFEKMLSKQVSKG